MTGGPRRGRWRGRVAALAAGTLVVLLGLELALRLAGWGALLVQAHRNPLPPDAEHLLRVMCVGESTSAGFYPGMLEEELNRRAGRRAVWVINRAEPGADTSSILEGLDEELARYRPDVVVAMMGANDCGGAIPRADVPVARRRGPFEHVKVLKAARYLSWAVSRERSRAAGQPGPDLALSALEAGLPARVREACDAERRGRGRTGPDRGQDRQREVQAAEAALRGAIRSDPSSPGARLLLADLLQHVRRYDEALDVLREAVRADPASPVASLRLGHALLRQKRYEEAREAYERTVALDPRAFRAWSGLASVLRAEGRDADLDGVIARALRAGSDSDVVLGLAAHHALRSGRAEEAEALFRRVRDVRARHACPMTVENYRRMHAVLRERGIGLVAVPYPFRSAEDLRAVLGTDDGVRLVDHEEAWRDALEVHGYDALFFNHCNGDSGHGTRLGDGILARSVADAVRDAGGLGLP